MPAEIVVPGLVDVQDRGNDPLYHFTKIYLSFFQGLFKQMPEGSWKWSDDERLSEIVITNQAPIPNERMEQRPAIVTIRGPAQFANLSLDNMRSVDPITGTKVRTDLVACTMTLCCLARLNTEAQRLAWVVARHLRGLKVMLQRAGIHKIGDEVSVGPETQPGNLVSPEPDPEMVMVTVQSPFFFQWTESIAPLDAPVVKAIEAHMKAIIPPAYASTTGARQQALKSATLRGFPIGNPIPIDDSNALSFTVKI